MPCSVHWLTVRCSESTARDRSVAPKTRMGRSNPTYERTEVILAELLRSKIIANEARLASERLGYPVDPRPETRLVSEIILSEWRVSPQPVTGRSQV